MEVKKCAIYIDLENIAPCKDIAAAGIPALMKKVGETIGQKYTVRPLFTVNFAAGNSESISPFDDTLVKYNFDVRNVKKISTVAGKSGNRADLIISLEAFETLLMPASAPEIYVFVTRDSDFSVIMGKLRRHGKQVLLVTDSVSANLDIFKNTADEIITFNDFMVTVMSAADTFDSLGKNSIAPVKMTGNFNPAVTELVKQLELHGSNWVLYTKVAQNVPYKKHGYSKFGKLVAYSEQEGIIETKREGKTIDYLRLKVNSSGKPAVQAETLDGSNKAINVFVKQLELCGNE